MGVDLYPSTGKKSPFGVKSWGSTYTRGRWNYKGGKPDGESRFYYESGELLGIKSFFEGKDHGETKVYYKNGNLKEQINFYFGAREGNHLKYFENGEVIRKVVYQKGLVTEMRTSKGARAKQAALLKSARKIRKKRSDSKSKKNIPMFLSAVLIIALLYFVLLYLT